jgi:hypothetical protein
MDDYLKMFKKIATQINVTAYDETRVILKDKQGGD